MSTLDVQVRVSRFGTDSFVVAVGGELDLHTSDMLRENLADALGQGARSLLVDLTGVTFIDTVALGVLVGTGRRLRASRGQLVLVADDPRIARLIAIAGLDEVLSLSPSIQEGVLQLVRGRRHG